MGVLAPGSAHARPSAQPPIDVSGNFLAHVSTESPSNIFLNPSEVISEVSEVGILIFFLLRSPCKIWEPYDNFLLEI
jgi:hypothetical protein